MPLFHAVPVSRLVCLTGMALVLSLGLSGCASSSAMQNQQETVAFSSFSDTLASDMYAAISPSAGERQEPLIEALSGLAPQGKTFAFADDIDINMPVPALSRSVSSAERRAAVLQAAGLQVREVGPVLYVEHAAAPAPVARAAAPVAPAGSQLSSSTLMNAPLLSSGEAVRSAPVAPAGELRSVATGEIVLATTATSPAPVVSSSAAMSRAEQTMANIEPSAAPVVLSPATRPIEVHAPQVVEPVVIVRQETVAVLQPVPEVPRAVEADPTVIAATDVNDRAIMDTRSGVASEPVATHALPQDSWTADRGQTLHSVLTTWSDRAGVQLVWSTDFDYPLAASVVLNDSYENAVRTLLSGFGAVSPQPVGRLHRQGNAGQRVLIVETRGNLYQDQ